MLGRVGQGGGYLEDGVAAGAARPLERERLAVFDGRDREAAAAFPGRRDRVVYGLHLAPAGLERVDRDYLVHEPLALLETREDV